MEKKELSFFNGAMASLLRNEFLLEEIIFQLILLRSPDLTQEDANEKFRVALKDVNDSLKRKIELLFPEEK